MITVAIIARATLWLLPAFFCFNGAGLFLTVFASGRGWLGAGGTVSAGLDGGGLARTGSVVGNPAGLIESESIFYILSRLYLNLVQCMIISKECYRFSYGLRSESQCFYLGY